MWLSIIMLAFWSCGSSEYHHTDLSCAPFCRLMYSVHSIHSSIYLSTSNTVREGLIPVDVPIHHPSHLLSAHPTKPPSSSAPPPSAHHRLPLLTITQTIPPPLPPPKPPITAPVPTIVPPSRTPRPRAQPRNRMEIRLRASTILRPPSLTLRSTTTIAAKVNRRRVTPAALLMGIVFPRGGLAAACWCGGA